MAKSFTQQYIGIIFFALFYFCTGSSFAQGTWTWMSGSNSLNSAGIFGTQGVPSVNNHPPCSYSSFCWTDKQGNFWLYGGSDASINYYGDMWKFNPATLEWTWVMGTGTAMPATVYGTQGVPNPINTPGGRYWSSCTWVDTSGDLWLYGGYSQGGLRADLWRYNIASNEWTWVNGSTGAGITPVYGTQGVPAPSNTPGSRCELGEGWVDAKNRFWLFGGDIGFSPYSDMWMYDPAINMWTWESGPKTSRAPVSYGTKGVFSANNNPGGRRPAGMVLENNGNFLVFGGNDGSYSQIFADLWEYNPSINEWAWLNGSQVTNVSAVAGATCQSDSSYYPDSRFENKAVWVDCGGNFWMFGGCVGQGTAVGDMWVFLAKQKQWARVTASSYASAVPVYGTLGVSSAGNLPGAKEGSAHWKDSNGNFWIYGGFNSNLQTFSDVWKYVPDTNCVITNCNCSVYVGSVSASHDSICSGQTSVLNVTATGALQWLTSTDGIQYTVIPGATSGTYSTTSLTQTTYYRALSINKNCSDTSAVKAIVITGLPNAGTITLSRDSICLGSGLRSILHVIQSSGYLKWQSSTDKNNFSDIPSNDTTVYITSPDLLQTTSYRVVAENNCGFDTSAFVTVYMVSTPVAVFNYTTNGSQVSFNSSGTSSNATVYNWDFGDGNSSSERNPVHTFSNADTFYVCLTVYNNINCSYTLCKYVNVLNTAVNNVGEDNHIQLYPNPANQVLNLSLNGLNGNYTIKIYNTLGQLEWQQAVNIYAQEIIPVDIHNFSPGAYQLVLVNAKEYYNKSFVRIK